MLYAIVRALARGVMRVLFRLEARGTEHVPRTGAVLLVANHSSVLDPPLVGAAAPRPLTFLAKAELFEIPVLGRLIAALNARPVRREGADTRALREAKRALEDGRALLVFPEGTRGPEGALQQAKPGAGMLAMLSGAPVIPVYVSGSGRVLPRGRMVPRPGRVRVRFGPPLAFKRAAGDERRERYQEVAREMMRAIETLMHEEHRASTTRRDGMRQRS